MMQMTFPSFLGDEHQLQTIMRDQEILARMKDDSLTFSNTSAMIDMKSPESREISFDDSPLAFSKFTPVTGAVSSSDSAGANVWVLDIHVYVYSTVWFRYKT